MGRGETGSLEGPRGRGLLPPPHFPSPQLATGSPQGFLANNYYADLGAQAQGSPHLLSKVSSLLLPLALQQGDGHAHFCR